jgi:hypothetical protein
MIVGSILIVIGVIALAVKMGLLSGSIWSYVWPSILIILGLSLLIRRRRWGLWWCGPWRWGPEEKDK